jgi:hypothetical protein
VGKRERGRGRRERGERNRRGRDLEKDKIEKERLEKDVGTEWRRRRRVGVREGGGWEWGREEEEKIGKT